MQNFRNICEYIAINSDHWIIIINKRALDTVWLNRIIVDYNAEQHNAERKEQSGCFI